jgi:hypothetical protein
LDGDRVVLAKESNPRFPDVENRFGMNLPQPTMTLFARSRSLPFVLLLLAVLVFVFPVFQNRSLTNFGVIYGVAPWSAHAPKGWFHSRSIDESPIYLFNSSDRLNAKLMKEGQSLFWNPYVGLGAPWLGSMQPAPYFPPKLISFLSPSYWKGQDALLILLLLTAGAGNYLFLRSMGVDREGALFAGLSCMLCQRLFFIINMPTFQIECLLPLMLFAVNEMLKRKSASWACLAGVIGGVQFLGGFPETSLIFVVVSSGFFLWMLVQDHGSRRVLGKGILLGLLVAALTLAISGFQLGEFVRLLSHANSMHSSAYGAVVKQPYWLLPLFVPNFFGTPFETYWTSAVSSNDHMPPSLFCGVSTVLLALIAILWKPPGSRKYVWFFVILLVLFAGYDYGFPVLRHLGRLPLFNLMSTAWNAFVIPFALSILAGFGLQSLMHRTPGRKGLVALALYAVIIVALCWSLWGEFSKPILASLIPLRYILPAFLISLFFTHRLKSHRIGTAILLCLVVAELFFANRSLNFLHYYTNQIDDPPSLKWLSEHTDHERILGLNGVYPANMLLPYRIRDIRHFDAIYLSVYVNYVGQIWPGSQTSVYDNGNPEWKKHQDLLLDLAAVKYVVSSTNLQGNDFILNRIVQEGQIETFNKALVNTTSEFAIANDRRRVLFQHPPAVVRYRTVVPPAARFVFGIGENPAAWELKGDGTLGTTFEIAIAFPDGTETTVFQRFYDPKHNPDDRRWVDASLDFAAYAGQEITLVLKTSCGRDGQPASIHAWDGWSGLYFETGTPGSGSGEVYRDGDVFIYRNDKALPRARFVPNGLKAPAGFSPADLQNSAADLTSSVFLEGYEGEMSQSASPMPSKPSVEYREDNTTRVRLHLSAPARGFVVLADLYYPGWEALVDGRRVPIYKANYAFRAVEVGVGEHDIVFSYNPWTTQLGVPVSVATVLGISLFWSWGFLVTGFRRLGTFRR